MLSTSKPCLLRACILLALIFLFIICYRVRFHGLRFISTAKDDKVLNCSMTTQPIGDDLRFIRTEKRIHKLNLSIASQPTVVCMILTTPNNWDSRARAVRNTWAKRCHIPIFFYSCNAADANHPILNAIDAVPVDVPEGRDHLTAKTLAALSYSLQTYGHVADWFLKADDDTYVIWENLLDLLGAYQKNDSVYIGSVIHTNIPRGYTSGGAGYLLSKPAAGLVVNEGPKHPAACHRDGGYEDVEIGRCLASFGVFPTPAIGVDKRLRFLSENPLTILKNIPPHNAYFYFSYGDFQMGNTKKRETDQILSNDSVTFHYMKPADMYFVDFLLYRLRRRRTAAGAVSGSSTTRQRTSVTKPR